MTRRAGVVAAFVLLGLVLVGPSAQAHALLKSSAPADGAQMQSAPSAVLLSFTEDPDPSLSFVHVLDQNGNDVEKGAARAVAGHPDELAVALGTLGKGVYTVNWRTVSRVDGHVTAGAFAFGVGVSPAGVTIHQPKAPSPSVLTVVSRWLFYSGLFLLLGSAAMVLFVSHDLARALPLALWGWIASAVGLLGLVEAQRHDAGVPYSHLLGSSIGHAFILRAIPLAIALVGVILLRRPGTRQAGFTMVLAAAAATVLAHVAEGHAATGSWRAGKILLQWAHIVAGGIWIGGLATILVGTGRLSPDARSRAVRRFSTLALWLIVVLSGAGVWRAFNEIASWHQLFSTSYGQVVIAKAVLLVALISLGAVNRYRNVPRAGVEPEGLRRAACGELVLATAVLVLTGILSSVAPARALPPSAPAQAVVVTGNDFGTTVRLKLTATPGFSGPNKFELKIADYNTDAPVHADQVSLRFGYLGPVQIGSSTLQLKPAGAGTYTGNGTNLSLGGVWTVTAVIQRGTASVEVPLTVPTRVTQQISISAAPGQPTLYTVTLGQGHSVQFYVARVASVDQVHATFFNNGNEFTGLSGFSVLATPPQGFPKGLDYQLLSPGHIVSNTTLTPGRWRFDVWARTTSGELLWSYFEPTIGK